MTHPNTQRHVVPTKVLTRSKLVLLTTARPVTTVVPHNNVTRPRPAKTIVTKPYSPPRRTINHSLTPKPSNFPQKVTTVKGVQGNWVKVKSGQESQTLMMSIFTDTECIVLSSDFMLPDESHVLLRVPRENNMYNVDLKNIVHTRDLTCLFAKATLDESNLWHRRLGHINFKTMNKLVKGNLVRGLPSKVLENNHTCYACKKGKQHIASWIKREFSVARIPQHNGIAERKNKTFIKAARTMLADSLLPIPFWVEVVNTACYIQNRVLVTKPHNKTSYELLLSRTPSIGFMRPFGCPVTILNTLDPLGKFNRKADEGFLVGYFVSSKAFRVFNSKTRIIQETLHINFLENKPNVTKSGPTWLFDIDTLTKSMNSQPVTSGNKPNPSAGIQEHFDAEKAREKNVQQYVLFPLWYFGSKDPQNTDDDTTFEVNKPEFEIKKPESEVHVVGNKMHKAFTQPGESSH
nr:ribonuclease H-like domain-containing protein [Tanacetum cinerariifolium]